MRLTRPFVFLALLAASPAVAQTTAVRFGRLVDGQGKVIQDAVVLVEGERVVKVGTGTQRSRRRQRSWRRRPRTAPPCWAVVHDVRWVMKDGRVVVDRRGESVERGANH